MELGLIHPERVVTLHRRACAWHREVDSAGDAIRHATAAGDIAEAWRALILSHWLEDRDLARLETLLGWLNGLPGDAVLADPGSAWSRPRRCRRSAASTKPTTGSRPPSVPTASAPRAPGPRPRRQGSREAARSTTTSPATPPGSAPRWNLRSNTTPTAPTTGGARCSRRSASRRTWKGTRRTPLGCWTKLCERAWRPTTRWPWSTHWAGARSCSTGGASPSRAITSWTRPSRCCRPARA